LRYVFGEHVEDEFLDIVEYSSAFFDGGEDGCEVVVGQHDVGSILKALLD